jgi:hypothetical protein
MSWLVELIIGFATLVLGNIFWSTLRGGAFQRKLIQDAGEVSKFIAFIGKEKFKSESKIVEPAFGSYSNNIGLFLSADIEALKKTRNLVGAGILGILIVSFLFNPLFTAINLCLFFIVSFMGIHSYVKNSVVTDIHSVMSNIYKWNSEDPDSCKRFCTEERPYLGTLYHIIAALN